MRKPENPRCLADLAVLCVAVMIVIVAAVYALVTHAIGWFRSARVRPFRSERVRAADDPGAPALPAGSRPAACVADPPTR